MSKYPELPELEGYEDGGEQLLVTIIQVITLADKIGGKQMQRDKIRVAIPMLNMFGFDDETPPDFSQDQVDVGIDALVAAGLFTIEPSDTLQVTATGEPLRLKIFKDLIEEAGGTVPDS